VSVDDFFIPPSPYTAANVEVTGRMSLGESKTVAITQANKIAIIVFDAVAGQRVTLGMSGVTIGAPNCCDTASVAIYKPSGLLLAPVGFGPGGNGTASQVLPVTGTYSLVVDPYYTNTGSVTLTFFEDVAVPISINGPPVTLNMSQVGQNGRLTFTGTAGQRVSVGMSGITISPGYCCDVGTVAIYRPNGTVLLAPYAFTNAGQGTPSQVLSVSGTYSIVVDPAGGRTGSVTVTLSEDLAPPTSINGPAVPLNFNVGQNARLTFDGTAGQRVSVGLSGITISPGYCCDIGSIAMYKPDGTVLLNPLAFTNAGQGTPSQVLPVTGTYSVVVDPYLGRSGNVTFTLSEDLAPPIAINDPPVQLNFNPGQNARLTFAGTAGQRVSVGLSGITIGTGYCCDIGSIAMYKPDGTLLLNPLAFTNAGQGTPSQVLPVTGTYSVVVDPYLARSGAATFTLSDEIAFSTSINNDPPTPIDFRSGQNARLTFSGTAGQRVSVGLNGITIGTGYCCDIGSIAMYKPDGTVLLNPLAFTNAGQGTPSQVLPVTGTYSVVVDPYLGRSGNVTFALSEDLNPQISISGPPVPLVFRVGQNAFVRFAGSASQHLTIRITSNALGYITVKLLKPDGTQLTSATSSGTSFNLPSQTLPVSGTYTISIDPPGSINGGLTVTANSP